MDGVNTYAYTGRIVKKHSTDPFTTFFTGSASLCYCAKPPAMTQDEAMATRWPQSIAAAVVRLPELRTQIETLTIAAVSGSHTTMDGEPRRPVLDEVAWADILARYASLRPTGAFDPTRALRMLDADAQDEEAGRRSTP